MFRFEEGRMYQMPVHFGPCCTPRQDPEGKRFCSYGPQESALHTLVCQTEGAAVERFLPEGFSLRRPYLFFTHKMHRNLPWLAGRGYNVVTCNVPVTYTGTRETVRGQYQLAIWESHADPILCGREQLGYSKLYAEIEDLHAFQGVASAALSSWGFVSWSCALTGIALRRMRLCWKRCSPTRKTRDCSTISTSPAPETAFHRLTQPM